MKRASLGGACLEGADFSEVTGLTRDQLAQAVLDENTILPNYLQEPSPEVKGPDRSSEE